ncbi:uncharacterized protein I303_104920 [Kwoniella dejecticola CBS 10117]|uniref:Amino acid transporter transmembrane domain-containing protein n=1 Tax=Kwoniella dejecticola CBS 10117 TaxID=1296121 RepID=A0A1A6A3Z2_9TREE|nr:uncharacterized protein I303_05634 [Kwoniella dejecticola CBS 10117]OBR84775.1 hypothetical protein I303_05634 [Kwoniella dejecticola CBS 10117]
MATTPSQSSKPPSNKELPLDDVEGTIGAAVDITTHDEVFGDIKQDGPNYRNVGWMGAIVLLLKSQIGLGVLSLPFALMTLGIVPGILCLVAIAAIMTWSGYCVGVFKLKHPQVYSVVDVGEIMFGRIGREVFAAIYCIFMIFVVGSAIVGASIGLNAVSLHGTCTAVFVAVSAILGFLLASFRTLGKISWLGWVGLVSIVSAILTVTIAVGVQDRPALAPQTGEWDKDFHVIGQPTFLQASSAISSLILAYAGVPTYFSIAAEMRDPRLFNRSMFISNAIITSVYIAIGTVVYYYCGQYVASPALGSAGVLMKRICYGLALPGLYVTVTIYLHLPAKYIFLRFMKGSRHLNSNSFVHWAVWLSCVFACTAIAYIIASAIPVFGSLVGLIGALFGTFFCIGLMGAMWIFDNKDRRQTVKTLGYRALFFMNAFLVLLALYLMISGTWGAVQDIIDSYNADGGQSAWSCKDNSNSV